MKIIASLTAYSSRMDSNGNRYWGFIFTDNETGKQVCGMISGGESNIDSIRYEWNGKKWVNNITRENIELPIRKFNNLTRNWSYAGCTGEDLVAYIKKGLASN